ncbi:substrate-binding periplasmic protein [Roseateles chitosanitabidus]|uniref:substrate-binding periplasmic protein n=1 Tax=Roseateles chitosanitabidus TaxID=65048 RepID=UPI00082DB3C2|nr:transporter substrate-binding domain-containing protein [Roseateles chitosanitabidus]
MNNNTETDGSLAPSSRGPDSARPSRARRALIGAAALGLAGLGVMSASGARGATHAAPAARVIRALIESWPPYLYRDADGTVRGLDAALLEAIARQAGYTVTWIEAPPQWRKRRYRELLADQFDVIFSATPSPDLSKSVMYTRSYRNEVMMVAAPARHDAQLDSLRGFEDLLAHRVRLLHVESKGLGADFEAHRARLDAAGLLIPYPTSRQGIDMLRLGRAPLILGDALDLETQARLSSLRLIRQPYGYSAQPVSLMLSRRRLDEADLARLDQAIYTLEQRGTLGAIRKQHGLP